MYHPSPVPLRINWTELNNGDAFQGTYEGHTGTFLRIPSGLLLLSGDRSGMLRNWVKSDSWDGEAQMIRMVNITFTVEGCGA